VAIRTVMRSGKRLALACLGLIGAFAAAGCGDPVARGREIYARHGCAVCHGQAGRGDGPAAKTLSPPPRDFADVRHYKEGWSRESIATTIRNGVRGSSTMPAFKDLSQDDAEAVAAWIVSLQRPEGSDGGGGQP